LSAFKHAFKLSAYDNNVTTSFMETYIDSSY